jgi:hypothetical protein
LQSMCTSSPARSRSCRTISARGHLSHSLCRACLSWSGCRPFRPEAGRSSMKPIHTEDGSVRIVQSRDRRGSFERRSWRSTNDASRASGFDDKIIALYVVRISMRDIHAHPRDLYGDDVRHDLISRGKRSPASSGPGASATTRSSARPGARLGSTSSPSSAPHRRAPTSSTRPTRSRRCTARSAERSRREGHFPTQARQYEPSMSTLKRLRSRACGARSPRFALAAERSGRPDDEAATESVGGAYPSVSCR